MKSFIEFISEDVSAFASKMSKPTFRPTAQQMKQLVDTTKAILGDQKASVGLSNFNKTNDQARLVKDGKSYYAYKLASNKQWYLSGEYETV